MAGSGVFLVVVGLFAAAVLYTAVGLAGASGYLAVLALAGVAPARMKPAALLLDLLAAAIATLRFARAGHVSPRRIWPYVAAAVPFAFVGGAWTLPGRGYELLVGAILIAAAVAMAAEAFRAAPRRSREPEPPSPSAAAACGAGIGLLAGLTGTGGGIFLAPLLRLTRWEDGRDAAGTTAAFVLVNAAAGLAGNLLRVGGLPRAIPVWAAAVAVGAIAGSGLGSRRLSARTLRILLALVLAVAGARLVFG